MTDQRVRSAKAAPPTPLEKLDGLGDPIERAAHAELLIAYARDRIDQAMAIRNQALREARRVHGARDIAEMTGIGLPTVRVVCR